jgi:two-component system nitrate/nitrite response regulator NarL
MDPVGAILVGSDALLREGLARVLAAAEFKIIASRSCIDSHVAGLMMPGNATLLLVDIGDDFKAALEQVEYFKRLCPSGRVAMLAHHHQFSEMRSAFQAGANAYFVKIASCEAFIKSLELVMLGETVLPPAMLTILDEKRERLNDGRISNGDQEHIEIRRRKQYQSNDNDFDASDDNSVGMQDVAHASSSYKSRLSARHKSILSCLIEGDSNKIIARKMSIAEATVKVHVKAILRRIRVHNRTQAAIWAMNSGLFFPGKDADRSAPIPVSPSALDVDVSPAALATGSSQIGESNGGRHVMLPDLALRFSSVVHRNDS